MDFVDPRHEMASIQRERPPMPLAQDRARTRINIDLIIAEGAVVRCSRFDEIKRGSSRYRRELREGNAAARVVRLDSVYDVIGRHNSASRTREAQVWTKCGVDFIGEGDHSPAGSRHNQKEGESQTGISMQSDQERPQHGDDHQR